MLWHVTQPLDAGVLVFWVGLTRADVDFPGDGLVDKGLLVFLKQSDPPLPRPDHPPDPPV